MSLLVYALIASQLGVVSWLDVKKHTISNKWALLNVVLAAVFYLALPESYPFKWELFLFPAGFIVFGFLLFLMGIMGAGDSKYLASLFLMVPLELHMPLFDGLLTSTVLVGSIMLSYKVFCRYKEVKAFLFAQYWQGLKDVIKSRFSYAPVIFLAWIYLGVRQWS